MKKLEKQIIEGYNQLDAKDQALLHRFFLLILEDKGFFESYCDLLARSGGLEALGVSGVERLLNAWEKTGTCEYLFLERPLTPPAG